MKPITVHSAGLTDTGMVRADNQDQFFVGELTRSMRVQSGSIDVLPFSRLFGDTLGHLFLVADGMGGHQGGSHASTLAIQFFVASILNSVRWLVRLDAVSEVSFTDDLKTMLQRAHREMQAQSKTTDSLAGMGTTLTMAYVVWPRMIVVHAGDTRCYIFRDGNLRLITRDHTVANQMMRMGQLDPESIERSPWSNVLVNALGAGAPDVFADIYKADLRPGDTILLCSDGLNKHVEDRQIEATLRKALNPQAACAELVSIAKDAGGTDNVTVVISQFEPSHTSSTIRIVAADPNEERILKEILVSRSEMDDEEENLMRSSTINFPNDRTTDSFPEE